MTKYLIGFSVLLLAVWMAYRSFSGSQGQAPEEDVNESIMEAAHEMAETVKAEDPVKMPLPEDVGEGPLPLFIGATWRYRVTDSRDTEGPRTFVLKIERAPERDEEGIASAGFEGEAKSFPVTDHDGDQRIAGLGFWAPLDFTDASESQLEGETFPRWVRLIDGAAWELWTEAEVTYRLANKKGLTKPHRGIAKARHRALAGKAETLTVPAGTFNARRIEWTSRVEIRTDDRPVLMPLTTEPYRRETMWIVPGVGIVKRSISFLVGEGKGSVLLELLSGPK